MNGTVIELDVIVIGGGIAGLWTLDALRAAGHRSLLLDQGALGGTQSTASQGMIHGGVKYALDGKPGAATTAIAAMPALWSACLAGERQPDLSTARVLSREFLLWSTASVAARAAALIASRALRGHIETLPVAARPAPLDDPRFGGSVYRLRDLVVDAASVGSVLAERHATAIFGIDWARARFLRNADGTVRGIAQDGLTLHAQRIVLCAGAGNEALLADLGVREPAMQRRPLHQVLVKHPGLPPLFGHCLGAGAKPRISISSHYTSHGERVWYLGGELAESGVEREPQQQITCAREELRALFPWLELDAALWRTLRIDRAEPRQSGWLRPDDAWAGKAEGAANVIVGWPTKLSLAPRLAERVLELLALRSRTPASHLDAVSEAAIATVFGRPESAQAPWEAFDP